LPVGPAGVSPAGFGATSRDAAPKQSFL